MTDLMMNDNNNHYSDVFGDEIKNHRRKKSKGKSRDPRTDQSELVLDFQNYGGPGPVHDLKIFLGPGPVRSFLLVLFGSSPESELARVS